MYCQEMLCGGSLSKLPEFRQRGDDDYSYLSSSTTGSSSSSNDSRPDKLRTVVGDLFDLSLLKSATFILVGLSGVIVFTGTAA